VATGAVEPNRPGHCGPVDAVGAAGTASAGGTAESQAAVDAQAAAVARAAADPDRMIRRAYSIASESRADEYLEFYLTVVMSGELTPRLFNLKIKDRCTSGPRPSASSRSTRRRASTS
jgi:hypothetical protein